MTSIWMQLKYRLRLVSSLVMGGALIASLGDGAFAQLVPDTTLGSENSRVTGVSPTIDQINGGATRGTNLFHSFQEFNVGEGRSVYFTNPTGIENILSRVTGTNPSNIFGKLGVNGNANLFVINPNGIIFGPNAQLDIRGSFFASTASSFKFSDGSEFSATNPQAPPLLTINVTPGLQWGTSQPGANISNRGKLAAGQDLTLVADKLDLQGQLQAGRDLTLLAQDTVKVREEVTTPFLALSGRNLTIQGNQGIDILALLHPTQTPFVSGGNLSLISDGIISGDARFSSGGSFSIQSVSGGLANFVSFHDPIISVSGDVDVAANYTGTSLLVEATGNIRFQGDINITGPDTSILPAGPDTATLSTGSALIMRSGQTSLAYGGVNSGNVPAYGARGVPAGITIGGDVIVQPFNGVGGTVSFSAASGNVNTRLITTNGLQIDDPYSSNVNANGGAISLEAANGSITTGDLSSSSFSDSSGNAGNGGAISLTANGSINTGNLSSFSISGYTIINISNYLFSSAYSGSGNAGDGGAISLTANGSINTGDLSSFSRSAFGYAGNGGAISLTANGSIITRGLSSNSNSSSYSLVADMGFNTFYGNAGNGGAISLTANGSINTGGLSSSAFSDSGNAGNGGAISLTANGSITTTGYLSSNSWSYSGNAGNGGAISLTANGSINTGYLYSYSRSDSGNGGNGGAISLIANGSMNTGHLDSNFSSRSGNGGNGGAISLTANGSMNTGYLYSYSSSGSGNAGQGGAISLTANGSINTGDLSSSASSDSGSGSQGGNISLEAANGRITFKPLYDGDSRDIDASGATGGNITLTSPAGLLELEKGSINSNASNGNGGNIQINAASVSLTNTELTTTARGNGNAGNISIMADGLVQLDFSRLFTSLEFGGIGKGGDITIEAGAVSLSSASFIDTATFGVGDAGNVSLKVDDSVLLDNNSAIFSITSGQGNGGNVRVEAGGAVSLTNRSNISTAVNLGAVGDGGNIDIVARSLSLSGGSQLITSTSSSGKAGNITVNTTEGVIISGVDPNFTPTQPLNVSVGNPSPLAEVEPNDSIAQAQRLTQFFLNSPNDVNPNVELSTRIPYVSISGMASGQWYIWPYVSSEDYYSFEITAAGTRAIFDIDTPQLRGLYAPLTLFDHAGNRLSSNSWASPSLGAGGSTGIDPYLRYVFSEPGTYFIQVRSDHTSAYTLQISLDTPNVATSVVNGTLPSGLFARTQGAGAAGNVTINTPQLTVFDGGNVSATATATATSSQQGSIKVNASQVNLSGNNSGLFALTEGAAPAGSLTLQPYNNGQSLRVNLQQGAQISASTGGSGQGGTLTVTAPESITLTGNGSIISAETSGSGTGGDLTLKTGTLTVRDEAKVTVSSTGTGNAGNLNVTANRVLLDNGELSAKTASGEGGNINLKVSDLLLMRNNSLISTQAGQNGNGGNLDIDARLIVAVPQEDSDIVADADRGNGGNINITTSGIFGLEYRNQRTPESDINASSRFGVNGTVEINTPGIDPSRGLANLPTEVVDASNQIDQTCAAGGREAGNNEFIITGRRGMPSNPYEMLSNEQALEDIHPPSGFSSSRNSEPVAVRTVTPQSATSKQKPPIVEAQGWVINDKGQVVLTATPTTATPHNSLPPSATCPSS